MNNTGTTSLESNSKKILGENIKRIRKEKGISVISMAEKLAVSKQTIYRYEDGKIQKIPAHLINDLCNILNVRPQELLEGTSNLPFSQAPDELIKDALPDSSLVESIQQFSSPKEAREFFFNLIKNKNFASCIGYDPSMLSDETVIKLANQSLEYLSFLASNISK